MTTATDSRDLRQRAAQIKDLEEQIEGLKVELKASYEIAKGAGYDVRALKQVVKELREDADKRAKQLEFEQVLDAYRHALGLLDGTPLGDWVKSQQAGPAKAKDYTTSISVNGGPMIEVDLDEVNKRLKRQAARSVA